MCFLQSLQIDNFLLIHAATFSNEAAKHTFSFNNHDYQVSANSADPDQTLTALANSEEPNQRSLIRTFFVCYIVSAYFEPHLCMVKTTLFDYSNSSRIRILRKFMNESCAG